MKFLPFAVCIGRNPDKMLEERLERTQLADIIRMIQEGQGKTGNCQVQSIDYSLRRGFKYLPLLETLYRDDEPNQGLGFDFVKKNRILVKGFACGRRFPNQAVSASFRDDNGTQFQVIFGEDVFLARRMFGGDNSSPWAEIKACYTQLFDLSEDRHLDYDLYVGMAKTFIEQVFSKPIERNFCEFKNLENPKFEEQENTPRNCIYEVRVLIPDELHKEYGLGWNFVKETLSNLGYQELKE